MSRVIGCASTAMNAADGISVRQICRMPLAIVLRRFTYSRLAAKRASVGNRIVAMATEKIPCGNM